MFKSIAKESKDVTSDMVFAWLKTNLPTLLSNYNLHDIYYTDEFGLFLPSSIK